MADLNLQIHNVSTIKIFLVCIMLISLSVTVFQDVAIAVEASSFSLSDEAATTGKRLLAETKDFAATPFDVESGNLLKTLGVVGALGLVYSFDTEIRDTIQKNRSRGIEKTADAGAIVGDPFLHLGVAALVYSGGILAESPKWKEMGVMLGEALILADGSTLILKEATGRGRPSVTEHKGDFHPFGFRSNYDSFPSMHTASSFAVASVLARKSENLPVAVMSYSAAALVACSRLFQNKHWASDVLLGAAIGELSGRVVTSYHSSHGNDQRLALLPAVTRSGVTMNIIYRF